MRTMDTNTGRNISLLNVLFGSDNSDLPPEFLDQMIDMSFSKGAILQHAYMPLQKIIYVKKGAVRAFEVTNYGIRTHRLLTVGDVFFDYSSKVNSGGKRITIQTSEDSELKMLDYEHLVQASANSALVREFLVQLAEKSLYEEVFHRTLLSQNEARTRIDILRSFFPGFFTGFTQRDLSGYLGIAVESYNRLYQQIA